MKLSRIINQLLSKLDIVVVRLSYFEKNQLETENKITTFSEVNRDVEDEILRLKNKLLEISDNQIKHRTYSKWSTIDMFAKGSEKKLVTLTCPICKKRQSNLKEYNSHCIFGGGDLVRHQCSSCDVIFGPQKMLQMSNNELSEDYFWHYKVYAEGDSTEQEKRAFHAMKPYKKGIYLNYGSGGWSNSIKELRDEGWDVYGYDPHSSLSNEYIIKDLETLQKMEFDGVFSNNVIEHFKHPIDELLKIKMLLKIGGLMSHASPCFEYMYEFTRFHLFFYTGRSVKYIANEINMDEEIFVDGEFINVLFKRNA